MYSDLAYLWPLVSPPEEYAREAACWRRALRDKLGPGRHRILELGAGGGHNLSHLAGEFEATAVDISEPMLAHSMRLNPGVDHRVGDMRTVRLGRTFAAVLIHDAINHMLSEEELGAAFLTAAAHLAPGGVLITAPDDFRETFRGPRICHRTHSDGETELTYFEYTHEPDPAGATLETVMVYMIRRQGRLRIEHDRFLTGLFPRATWDRLLHEAGFPAVEERRCTGTGEDHEHWLLVATR